MAIDLKEFDELKKSSDRAKTEFDKATGALEEQQAKLAADFNVDSIEAGEALVIQLESEEAAIERQYTEEKTKVKEKWKGKL